MKFTLLTKQQRFAVQTAKLESWHKKFAWLPIRMTNDKTSVVWLEFVLRKGKGRWYEVHRPMLGGKKRKISWDWTYVESTFDVLKMDQ